MAKVYEFLANGFEEIEGMAPVDILRRAGIDIKTVSISGNEFVETSHGITVKADLIFEETNLSDADLLMLPGGMPGSTNLNAHDGLKNALLKHNSEGKKIAAICAAPMVLGGLGLLKGKRATCSPGFEKYMDGAVYTHELCTVDGNITTGEGPAATLPYAYTILESFVGKESSKNLQKKMQFAHLMGNE